MELFNTVFVIFLIYLLGVPLGIAYPFSPEYKIIYIITVLVTLLIAFLGFKFRKKIIGLLLIVISLLSWGYLGLIGMSYSY